MRVVEKEKCVELLDKGAQHQRAADAAMGAKDIDAAITNYAVALINYLDALSVNRFGKDLSSDNHEAAPPTLQQRLSGIGIPDFKPLQSSCVEILKMKNVASYRAEPLTEPQAKRARATARKAREYVESRLDRTIGRGAKP